MSENSGWGIHTGTTQDGQMVFTVQPLPCSLKCVHKDYIFVQLPYCLTVKLGWCRMLNKQRQLVCTTEMIFCFPVPSKHLCPYVTRGRPTEYTEDCLKCAMESSICTCPNTDTIFSNLFWLPVKRAAHFWPVETTLY